MERPLMVMLEDLEEVIVPDKSIENNQQYVGLASRDTKGELAGTPTYVDGYNQ
jgi:hypothetical protein